MLQLKEKHRALMRELVSGASLTEAARAVGVTVSRASLLLKDPLFQAELDSLRARVEESFVQAQGSAQSVAYHQARLLREAGASVDTLVALRDSARSEAVRQKSAMEILDRAGVKTPAQVEGVVQVEMGDGVEKMLASAARLLAEQAKPAGEGKE